MEENYYLWLKNTIENSYSMVRNIKRTSDTTINVMMNNQTEKKVVVKYVLGNALAYRQMLDLQHSNIPIIYEVASDNDCSIIIEEYIDGITIGEILETGVYASEGVKKIILELCKVLSLLHENGIIHRDIKPENIIITNHGDVKLIDFDISRIGSETADKDTVILGTTGFAAPEQYGIAQTDARSDIYSLGVLINVMLTGEHPSKRMCKGKWQRIVNKCTKINPDERYQNVTELMKVI